MARRSKVEAGSLSRVLPYVWPHRKPVLLSFVFAVLVAVLWGLNLSVAFPVVKVLLEGQSLPQYVASETQKAEAERAYKSERLARIEARIAALTANRDVASRSELVTLYKDQASAQARITEASRTLFAMSLVRSYALPWLPEDKFDLLALILGVLLGATALKGVFIFIQDVLVGSVIERTVMDLRKTAFRKTLALDYQTVAMDGTPELMSRFTNDMNMLAYGLQLLGGKVVREPLKAITCLVGALIVSWQLTLLSLVFAPIAGVIFYRIGKKLKAASHRSMESMSRIYKTLEETFDAIKVVLAFNAAPRHRRRFHAENKEYYRKAMRIVRIDALTSPATEVLGILAAFGALLPGAYLVLRGSDSIWGIKLSNGNLDIAELTMLYVFLAGIIDPLRKLSSVYGKVKRSTAAADRIFSLIDRKPLVREVASPALMPRHSKSIEFRRIEFHYAVPGQDAFDTAHRQRVLDDLDWTVKAGEVVAVVGENGSGKSTLVNLLPRFYDPTHGAVLIDGVDLRDVSLRDLRGQIGVVTQETMLFDDTIYENIRYGKPGASPAEVEAAAKQARVLDFVAEMTDGLQTRVGEKGRRLSGGQRQRVALARAILRDPAIFILDEATSAIDATSERLIHEAMREFCRGRTVFLITHAVTKTLLEFVTQVAVMDHGRLVAYGPHDAVYETCPAYRKLYRSQIDGRTAPRRDAGWDDDGGPHVDDLAPRKSEAA
ncbi:MAG: ABC transporter ATP-binding protein/permease [Planctomycetota bacterium]|nr:ABC transporter ATP-binding protein/permease [Planctomycetota bacterium]